MGEQVASLNHHSLYHEYENNYEKDEAAKDGAVKEGRSDMLTFQVVRVVVVFWILRRSYSAFYRF